MGKNKTNPLRLVPLLVTFAFVSACGGGGDDSALSVPGQVIWSASDNGSTVLDGNGATFYFSASSGCLYSTLDGVGPAGFCLTSTSGTTGPTGCTNPASNTSCDAASFRVWYTHASSGPGCIAVLGALVTQNYYGPSGTLYSTVTQVQPLNITYNNGFYIQTYRTYGFTSSNATAPTVYSAYWNGQIPSCIGPSSLAPYVAGYTLTTAATCSNFGTVTNASHVYSAPIAIDASGLITDNGTKRIWGTINSGGTGSFTGLPSATISSTERFTVYTIGSAAQNGSGKWVLQGTFDPATVPVNCGTFNGTFTATEN